MPKGIGYRGLNKSPKVVTKPTSANRSLNKPVHALKKASPANRSLNPPAKVSPSSYKKKY